MQTAQLLLVLAVAVVGVLHTLVPDHWVPIALVARQHGWTQRQTAGAALKAGTGHVLSTLVIGVAVWLAGAAFATRFGNALNLVSSIALIGFGLWIAIGSVIEQRQAAEPLAHGHGHGREPEHERGHSHDHAHVREENISHRHPHRHASGPTHVHLHAHGAADLHDVTPQVDDDPPLHDHEHKTSGRTALLLILGSSPMVEGIPAFFAASRYGIGLMAIMALVFAAATIATYVSLCVYFADRLRDISIGPLERYGEVLSGAFIALVGAAFLVWPLL